MTNETSLITREADGYVCIAAHLEFDGREIVIHQRSKADPRDWPIRCCEVTSTEHGTSAKMLIGAECIAVAKLREGAMEILATIKANLGEEDEAHIPALRARATRPGNYGPV